MTQNSDNGAIANRCLLLELQYLPDLSQVVSLNMISLRFWLAFQVDRIGWQGLIDGIPIAPTQPPIKRLQRVERMVDRGCLQPLGLQLSSVLPDITGGYIQPGLIAPGSKPHQLPPVDPLGIVRFSRLPEELLNLPVK